LAHRSRGWKVFRTILFIPQVVSSAAIALLWLALYNSEYGLVNYLLDYIGLSEYKNHNWLGSLRTAQPALIAFSLCYVGYFMVIMLAKTAGISDDYYDAATIDGASQFQKDLHITAPLIKSTFFLCIILAVIFNLRQFEFVYLMTNGGPANRTSVLVLYIWKELSIQRLGLGNAAGVIMISLGAILLIIMRKILKSETYN
jgi:raffinose/stachyose/melibiose transport system permease protein